MMKLDNFTVKMMTEVARVCIWDTLDKLENAGAIEWKDAPYVNHGAIVRVNAEYIVEDLLRRLGIEAEH